METEILEAEKLKLFHSWLSCDSVSGDKFWLDSGILQRYEKFTVSVGISTLKGKWKDPSDIFGQKQAVKDNAASFMFYEVRHWMKEQHLKKSFNFEDMKAVRAYLRKRCVKKFPETLGELVFGKSRADWKFETNLSELQIDDEEAGKESDPLEFILFGDNDLRVEIKKREDGEEAEKEARNLLGTVNRLAQQMMDEFTDYLEKKARKEKKGLNSFLQKICEALKEKGVKTKSVEQLIDSESGFVLAVIYFLHEEDEEEKGQTEESKEKKKRREHFDGIKESCVADGMNNDTYDSNLGRLRKQWARYLQEMERREWMRETKLCCHKLRQLAVLREELPEEMK